MAANGRSDSGVMLSHDDRRLVHALQLRPRISWTALSRVLGADPVTLSRRWHRLRARGVVWMSVYSGGQSVGATGLLEISCRPSASIRVATTLGNDPEVLTVDITTGKRDLVVTVLCRDQVELSHYLVDRMGMLSDVTSVRTLITTSSPSWGYRDARNWRLDELTNEEVMALQEDSVREWREEAGSFESETILLPILQKRPRISITELAKELDVSAVRARTLLLSALGSGHVVLRTEIARPYSGWPVYVWYFLRLDIRRRGEVVAKLGALREARLVAATIGDYDIAFAAWLRSIDDVQRLEIYIAKNFPSTQIDCSVVLRTPVHVHLALNEDGLFPSGE